MTATHQFVSDLADLLARAAAVDEAPHPRPVVLPAASQAVAGAAENALVARGVGATSADTGGGYGLVLGNRDSGFAWPA